MPINLANKRTLKKLTTQVALTVKEFINFDNPK